MPVEQPDLDDRSYAELVDEAHRLIVSCAPDWTNHNPSDPGITLVELFAYLTEMLLYRLDRVTEESQRKFLKLLGGAAPTLALDSDRRETIRALRAHYRAVTVSDFEILTLEDFNDWRATLLRLEATNAPDVTTAGGVSPIKRCCCAAGRNYDRGTEDERAMSAPGHVSLVVVPGIPGTPVYPRTLTQLAPSSELKSALWGFLDERRTLTTRHHVVGVVYSPIAAEIVIALSEGAWGDNVVQRVLDDLNEFLDPLRGGTDGQGWPFGRDVFASELYERLKRVSGVDYVVDLMLTSTCLPTDSRCAPAPALWHTEGDPIGMSIAEHHLPLSRLDKTKIVVAPQSSFIELQLTVTVDTPSGPPNVKQAIKAATRKFFHPLQDGPGVGTNSATALPMVELRQALDKIEGVQNPSVDVRTVPDRISLDGQENSVVNIQAHELVNWNVMVVLRSGT